MPKGFNGRVAHVNLSTGNVSIEAIDEKTYRTYPGGSALAFYFLLRDGKPRLDPFDPENLLVFAPGSLAGAPVPGCVRYTVAAKSPLTGAVGETEAGGWWAPELKKTGLDAVTVVGRSERPVYLWVSDDGVEIREAAHLWGKNTGQVQEAIREELGDPRARIAAIGQAGETLVRYACILNELRHVNGRTGMGAVMGSKHLKAVAVRGTRAIPWHDPTTLKTLARDVSQRLMSNAAVAMLHELGTQGFVLAQNMSGTLPTLNFRSGEFSGVDSITAEAFGKVLVSGGEGCYGCPVRCKRALKATVQARGLDPRYGGPEYETIGAFGSACGVSDPFTIARAHELCNSYGLDTISTGITIAFVMECFERGVLTSSDTGGLDVRFGDAEAVPHLIEMIATRKGIGDLLAEGSLRAASQIGRGSEMLAMQVKGQELPLHEPRGKAAVGLGYAVSPTGADHLEAAFDTLFAKPSAALEEVAPLGILEPMDPLSLDSRKVRMFAYTQHVNSLYNALGICYFVAVPGRELRLSEVVDTVEAAMGWNTSLWELMKVGQRTTTLARIFNVREGFTRANDVLPRRFFEPLESGVRKGAKLGAADYAKALDMYYEMMGWDVKTGIPLTGALAELGLEWAATGVTARPSTDTAVRS